MAVIMTVLCLAAGAETSPAARTLKGYVRDAADGSPLTGVTVYMPEIFVYAVTDTNGYYFFKSLPARELTVQVSMVGHRTIARKVNVAVTDTANFQLSEESARLGEVVVTGTAGSVSERSTPLAVDHIDRAQLMATPSTNVIDALSRVPGMSEITTSGGISKPVIRGLGFNRLLVINDGVRQEGNQWGDEHGIEIDDGSVASAEVIKGPASLMYGADAMAGVIIMHDMPSVTSGTVKADVATQYHSNSGLFGATAGVRGSVGGWTMDGRFSTKMAHDYKNPYDGYVVGSRFRDDAAKFSLGYGGDRGYSRLKLSYYHLTPGMPEGGRAEHSSSYSKALPFQQVRHYKVVSANSFYALGGNIHAVIGYQQNRRQEYEESADEPGLDLMLHTLTYDARYSVTAARGLKLNTGVGGMWQRNVNKGSEFLIPSYALFDAGLYVTASYALQGWDFSGGTRADMRHLRGFALEDLFTPFSRSFYSVSGALGAIRHLSRAVDLKLNVSRGFRAPNLSELASNGVHEGTQQYMVGNTRLRPENNVQVDAGCDYSTDMLGIRLSAFANFIRHYIYSAATADAPREGVPVFGYTQGNARLLGGELSADFHPIEPLHIASAFSYVNGRLLHHDALTRYLPWMPAPRINSEVRYTLIHHSPVLQNTYLSASMDCYLRQNHYYKLNGTETATPSSTLFHLAAGTDIKAGRGHSLSLLLSLQNIFNRAWQSNMSRLKYIGGVNESNGRTGLYNEGRNFVIKLAYNL